MAHSHFHQNENKNDSLQPLRRSSRLKQKKDETKRQRLCGRKRKRSEIEIELECDWIGSFGDLSAHIKKCKLQMVSCRYCKQDYLRRDEGQHFALCLDYPIICVQCDHKIKRALMQTHIISKCPMTEIECKQGCGQRMIRRFLDEHIKNECAETLIVCGYQEFGCNATFKRKNRENHHRVNIDIHLRMVREHNSKVEKELNLLRNERKPKNRGQNVSRNERKKTKLIRNTGFEELCETLMSRQHFEELRICMEEWVELNANGDTRAHLKKITDVLLKSCGNDIRNGRLSKFRSMAKALNKMLTKKEDKKIYHGLIGSADIMKEHLDKIRQRQRMG